MYICKQIDVQYIFVCMYVLSKCAQLLVSKETFNHSCIRLKQVLYIYVIILFTLKLLCAILSLVKYLRGKFSSAEFYKLSVFITILAA